MKRLAAVLAPLTAVMALAAITARGGQPAGSAPVAASGEVRGGQMAERMRAAGLVDLASVDSTIAVRLAYATTDNFAGKDMYGGFDQAWVRPEIAQMLVRAQAQLRKAKPGYSLLVLDAARPFSVQKYLFSLVEGTPRQKYVANPNRGGGKHNYGVAVDITVVDAQGRRLDMGSPFDHFGAASHTGHEADLVARRVITKTQAANRKLLTDIMKGVGFHQDPNEWWHFDRYTMAELRRKYKRLDF